MTLIRGVCSVVLAVALAACASKGEDYFLAKEMPPLTLPEGQESRQIKPLFPIPPVTAPQVAWPKKFEVPRPRPIEVQPAPEAQSPTPQVVNEKPALTVDGNGYTVLSVQGEFNAVWDQLDQALRAAGVKVEDRDQGLSQYFLNLADADGKKATYQLRVMRGQSAYNLTLQKDDDTLASQDMTRTLFESIVARWPGDKP
jgi:uncharacterized lipoprotein